MQGLLPPLNDHNLPWMDTIHPIVVHFVIAMAIITVVFDLIGVLARKPQLFEVSFWNLLFATAANIPLAGAAVVIPTLAATDFRLVGIPPVPPVPPVPPAPVTNVINGTAGNDTLNGTAGADTINGLAGNDTINGQGGNDIIDGGLGNDSLTGGAGNDRFNFSTAPNTTTNRDTLTDFTQGTDRIGLSRAVFSAFGATATTVAAAQITTLRGTGATGTVATGTFLIYDRDTSQLFYDPSAGNATDRVQILSTGARLVNTDFVLF